MILWRAIDALTARTNLMTGLTHPNDRNAAKELFVRLRDERYVFTAPPVIAYALRCGWELRDAKELGRLAADIRSGRRVRFSGTWWPVDLFDYLLRRTAHSDSEYPEPDYSLVNACPTEVESSPRSKAGARRPKVAPPRLPGKLSWVDLYNLSCAIFNGFVSPMHQPNPRRIEAGRQNRKKRGKISDQAREQMKVDIQKRQPWLKSTGPRTAAGKAKSAANGKSRKSNNVKSKA